MLADPEVFPAPLGEVRLAESFEAPLPSSLRFLLSSLRCLVASLSFLTIGELSPPTT